MLSSGVSQVQRIGDEITKILDMENVNAEDLLRNLDEEREQYYRENYANDKLFLILRRFRIKVDEAPDGLIHQFIVISRFS